MSDMEGSNVVTNSPPLDPRRAAFRPDLADSRLQGQVPAERFEKGRLAMVGVAIAPMFASPPSQNGGGSRTATLLRGEMVRVFDEDAHGCAWAQAGRDGYVGYLSP